MHTNLQIIYTVDSYLPCVQIWIAKSKKKSLLHSVVCSITCYTFFPSFEQFINTTLLKIFLSSSNHSSSHFLITWQELKSCSASGYSSMQTSGNQKEQSLVRKPHGIEFPNWMSPMCCETVLPYTMEHC